MRINTVISLTNEGPNVSVINKRILMGSKLGGGGGFHHGPPGRAASPKNQHFNKSEGLPIALSRSRSRSRSLSLSHFEFKFKMLYWHEIVFVKRAYRREKESEHKQHCVNNYLHSANVHIEC